MNQRIEKLFESEENIAYLVFDETNRFYLTGFDSDAGAVVLTRDKHYFLVDSRYSEDAQAKCADFEVIEERPSGLHARICELLKSAEVSAVYLENRTLRHEEYLAAAADFSEFEVRNLGDRLELLRAVKTEEEISKIAAAQGIAERAFEKMKAILKVGVSERDAAIELEYQMMKLGAECASFPTIVAFDENASKPHCVPSQEHKLKNNSIVLVDFGAKVSGYCSDTTRTFCFGKPSEEFANVFSIVGKAVENMEKFTRAGVQCNEADGFCRELIAANGYGANFLHSTGHGVGLDIHEYPGVGMTSKVVLEENMVITCEPGIYLPGKFGVRTEDLLVVKSDHVEVLTKLPKELN